MSGASDSPNLDAVPLFPLPNVVLFPRAVLPLHIFEFRYRQMTADAMRGDRLTAMALLKPGWEKDYHGRPAIDPVVCVGKIISCEKLPDGKYNFLLQGLLRAAIRLEYADRPYRYARLAALPEANVLEIDLSDQRQRLSALFNGPLLADCGAAGQVRRLLAGPLPTADVADLIAFQFIEKVELKQQLLAETDPRARVRKVIAAVEELLPMTATLPPGRESLN